MGTRGFKVYRYKGWYFVEFNEYDSEPTGFGLSVLSEVPTDPEEFREWLENMHDYLGSLLDDNQETLDADGSIDEDEDEGFNITRTQPTDSTFIEWVYEIDLDRLIFHIDSTPMYRLDHMPPKKLFLKGIASNVYKNRACHQAIPAKYRFNPDLLPAPPVESGALEKYQNSMQEGTPCTVNTLLSLSQVSVLESIVIAERTAYFHITMLTSGQGEVTGLALVPDAKAISKVQRCVALNLAALALLPVSHMLREHPGEDEGDVASEDSRLKPHLEASSSEERVWWPRRHICVLLATHLIHEDNRKAAIVQVVEEVMKKGDAPNVAYGVVFSVFHCVLVRIDRKNGAFIHTGVLRYCPDLFTSAPPKKRTTAGLEAMVRLGNMAADDDEDFYYTLLHSSQNFERFANEEGFKDQNISQAAASTHQPRVPQEMLHYIAEFIDDPRALSAFAIASRSTMSAALPRLRLPNIVIPRKNIGVILQRKVAPSKDTKLTRASFRAQHDGRPVTVTIMDGYVRFKNKEDLIAQDCLIIPFVFKPPPGCDTLLPCEVCYTISRTVVRQPSSA